jgi:hypothetical protein
VVAVGGGEDGLGRPVADEHVEPPAVEGAGVSGHERGDGAEVDGHAPILPRPPARVLNDPDIGRRSIIWAEFVAPVATIPAQINR